MAIVLFEKGAGVRLGILGPKDTHASGGHHDALVASQLRSHARLLGLDVDDVEVFFDGRSGTATLHGHVESRGDAERLTAAVGNAEGVAAVEDCLDVDQEAPRSHWHTVRRGDTLASIARENYGAMRLFEVIFEANLPVIDQPDRIHPGQVLRIPMVDAPRHLLRPGETLEDVAAYWYGDRDEVERIREANPGRSAPGAELVIPLEPLGDRV